MSVGGDKSEGVTYMGGGEISVEGDISQGEKQLDCSLGGGGFKRTQRSHQA